MEVFRLHDTGFKPLQSSPKFDTLTWTERYQSAGEFQLVVEDDISILTTFPLGSIISHSDTKEVMTVENHEIDRDANKKLKVTVSGRSIETAAETRVTAGSEQPLYINSGGTDTAIVEDIGPGTPSALAVALVSSRVTAGTEEEDSWLNTTVSADMHITETSLSSYILQRGDVYPRLIELLKLSDAGIKSVRPTTGTALDVIIHDGEDLTDSVIFYSQYEDLDDAKYFSSVKDYRTYAWVQGKYSGRVVMARGITDYFALWGRDRRYLYVPAQDLEGTYFPGPIPDEVIARGQNALDQHAGISILQATISATARPKFKINYDVGDIVTVFGEFNTAQVMRVTEHILTADKDGIRGYPALTIL